jgi:hypothetical protein
MRGTNLDPCPFCGSPWVDAEFVDIGVGMQQVTGAICFDCEASQDDDGEWHEGPNSPPKGGVAPKTAKKRPSSGVDLGPEGQN